MRTALGILEFTHLMEPIVGRDVHFYQYKLAINKFYLKELTNRFFHFALSSTRIIKTAKQLSVTFSSLMSYERVFNHKALKGKQIENLKNGHKSYF